MLVWVAICTPPLNTLYPATPTLSVEAVHVRLICVEETATAATFVGTDGGIVSCVPMMGVFMSDWTWVWVKALS